MRARVASTSLRGSTRPADGGPVPQAGAGNAARSILAFGVSGSAGMATTSAGIM